MNFYTEKGQSEIYSAMAGALVVISEQRSRISELEATLDWYKAKVAELERGKGCKK